MDDKPIVKVYKFFFNLFGALFHNSPNILKSKSNCRRPIRLLVATGCSCQVLSSSELNLFVQIATSGDSTVAAAIGKRYLPLGL